jgi:hypothetical protein
MLASEHFNEKTEIQDVRARLACAVVLLVVVMTTGCCHMVVRGPLGKECGSPIIECVDPNQCEPADRAAFNHLDEINANCQVHHEQLSARFSDRLHVCSARMRDLWNESCIERWKAEQREKRSAPPYPRFHPLPTHPAFYPELQ